MLSIGAIQDVCEGSQEHDLILQVIGIKKLPGVGEGYRVNISDGRTATSLALLDPRLNNMMREGKLTKHAIIKTKIFCHIMEEKRVLVLQEVKIINHGRRVNGIFGCPVNIDYQEIPRCAKCTAIHKCSK